MTVSKDNRPPSFAIYLHWPFCLAKCPYCDFNSHVRDNVDQEAWRQAFLMEIDHAASQLGPRFPLWPGEGAFSHRRRRRQRNRQRELVCVAR